MTTNLHQPGVVILSGTQANAYIRTLELGVASHEITVSSALRQYEGWLTRNASASTVKQHITFCTAFARGQRVSSKPLSSVQEHHVNAYVNCGTKLGSRRVRLAIIRGFFKFCSARELLVKPNPALLARVDFNSISHENKESRITTPFTDADFETIIAALEKEIAALAGTLAGMKSFDLAYDFREKIKRLQFWRAAIVISRCSGLRLGDCCQLERATLATGEFTVWSDKRNRRVQPFIWRKELFDQVLSSLPASSEKYFFPEARQTYLNPSTRCSLNAQFSRMAQRHGLSQSIFHAWRYSYSCGCLRDGIEMPHISSSMGHSSIAQTRHYAASQINKPTLAAADKI